MPSTTNKRKADPQSGNKTKKAKSSPASDSKSRAKLPPLSQRDINRAPADCHQRKKDGNCRKDCRICKDENYEWDALNNPEHTFHGLHVYRAKGRDGSPTLDQAGASLKPTLSKEKKFSERMANKENGEQQMLDLFFEDGAAPDAGASDFGFDTVDALKERVEKGIGIPWHKIGVQEVREWEKKGFKKAKKGEYKDFTSKDRKRHLDLHQGCVLRK